MPMNFWKTLCCIGSLLVAQQGFSQIVALSNALTCAPAFSGAVQTMGRAGGLIVTLPATGGCAQVGWGFDMSNAVNFSFAPPATNYLNYSDCETNLNRGLLVMYGNSTVTYYTGPSGTTSTSLTIRCTIQFTSNGTTPIPVKRNGNIVFNSTAATFQVKFTLEADASALASNARWNGASYNSWAPALTLFDNLATTTNNQVQTGLTHRFYNIGNYTTATGITNNSGNSIQNAGNAGGMTVTYTNSSGQTANIGFDAATAFRFSYQNNSFTQGGSVMSFSTATWGSGSTITFTGCSPLTYVRTTGASVTRTITTQFKITFVGASATWKDGFIYATVANGATLQIKYELLANASNLSPAALGYSASGMQPLRPMYDALHTTGNYYTSVTPVYFYPATDPVAYGTTITWTGATGTDPWELPCNWTCRVPTLNDDVVIPSITPFPRIATGINGECRTINVQGGVITRLLVGGGALKVGSP